MIIEITARNIRSIKDKQVFSMLPSKSIKENTDSLLKFGNQNILSTSVIYGRNASGKSNLLEVFNIMQMLVIFSHNNNVDEEIKEFSPYKLDNSSPNSLCELSIEFIAKDDIRYLYEIAFSGKEFIKENLYHFPKGQKSKLFERQKDSAILFGDSFKGKKRGLEELLYPNQLLLSKANTQNFESLHAPLLFFKTYFLCLKSRTPGSYASHYAQKLADKANIKLKNNISNLLRFADTGIEEIDVKVLESDKFRFPDDMPEAIRKRVIENNTHRIVMKHPKYINDVFSGFVEFDPKEESVGTQKLLDIGSVIIEALMDGQVLIIDEFDSSLHPKLTEGLIKLFKTPNTNPNKAQLIIATHDISLLNSPKLFRRDEIWLAEKEDDGSSNYYTISDIKGIRSDAPLEQLYMSNKLGGTPVISELNLEL